MWTQMVQLPAALGSLIQHSHSSDSSRSRMWALFNDDDERIHRTRVTHHAENCHELSHTENETNTQCLERILAHNVPWHESLRAVKAIWVSSSSSTTNNDIQLSENGFGHWFASTSVSSENSKFYTIHAQFQFIDTNQTHNWTKWQILVLHWRQFGCVYVRKMASNGLRASIQSEEDKSK